MNACKYEMPWAGCCGEPCELGEAMCEKHKNLECRNCGAPAVKGCPSASSMVCGAPLCKDCRECDSHRRA